MGQRPNDKSAPDAAAKPAHEVKVSAFWMSQSEVTIDLFYEWLETWSQPLGEQPAPELLKPELKDLPIPEGLYSFPDYHHFDDFDGNRPATGLTQYAAQHFCQWLSARTGRRYRLPTEAEWEYAARAGTDGAWPSGKRADKLKDYAWFAGRQEDGSHAVGLKKPNAWGFHDMSGNASEWVLDGWSDDYSEFATKTATDPWIRRKPGRTFGVVRGGAWTDQAADVRVTSRYKERDWAGIGWQFGWRWFDLGSRGRAVGLRVVSPVKPEKDGRERYLRLPEERR